MHKFVVISHFYNNLGRLIDVESTVGHDVFNCWAQLKPDVKLLITQLSSDLLSKGDDLPKNPSKHGQLFQLMDALTRNYQNIITTEHHSKSENISEDSINDLVPALERSGFSWLLDMDYDMMEHLLCEQTSGGNYDSFALFSCLCEPFGMRRSYEVLKNLNDADSRFASMFERTMSNYRLLLFAILLKGAQSYETASEYVSGHPRPLEHIEESPTACHIVSLSASAIAICCVTVRYVVDQLEGNVSHQALYDAINKGVRNTNIETVAVTHQYSYNQELRIVFSSYQELWQCAIGRRYSGRAARHTCLVNTCNDSFI